MATNPCPYDVMISCDTFDRFDDAYFLEPDAVRSASKARAPDVDVPKPGVSAARGGPGGHREDGGDNAKVTAMAVAAVPGVPLDGADGETSYGGRDGGIASAKREGRCCAEKQGGTDGGRCRGAGTGGAVTRPVDAIAVDREKKSGDGVEVGIDGGGLQHQRDCGIVCQGQGVGERAGEDGTRGDIAAGGERPAAPWTTSKRPRKEEAKTAAAV